MKHDGVRKDAQADARAPVAPLPRRRHPKLALVRPIVAPVDEYVAPSADPRDAIESAALAVMRECQRATFYR